MVNDFNQLYYQDAYRQDFKTVVIAAEQRHGGNWLSFRETCFYPLGGGQPGDQGFIQILPKNSPYKAMSMVSKVTSDRYGARCMREIEDMQDIQGSEQKIAVYDTVWHNDKIWHRVSEIVPVNTLVYGKINFARRFDFMQQHSGEHIISGIVKRDYGYQNVGFHINEDITTFDFDGDLTWKQIEKLEEEANQAIFENIPIEVHYLNREEQKKWQYRSKIALDNQVRIVLIPNYDCCACAGTHVHSTAEIGFIKIINRESYKGGVRLTVLCGQRCLKQFQKTQKILREMTVLFSANSDTLLSAAEKKEKEITDLKAKIRQKNHYLAKLLLENCQMNGQKNIIIDNTVFHKNEWHDLSSQIAKKTQGFVALLTKQNENQYLLYLYSQHHHLAEVKALLQEKLSFQGGGNQNILQGIIRGEKKEIETILHNITEIT